MTEDMSESIPKMMTEVTSVIMSNGGILSESKSDFKTPARVESAVKKTIAMKEGIERKRNSTGGSEKVQRLIREQDEKYARIEEVIGSNVGKSRIQQKQFNFIDDKMKNRVGG